MCGICGGLWTEPEKAISQQLLDRMTDLLHHRGPDDRGTCLLPGLAFGHRRLSILDLSPSGRQPMTNEDESLQIVFNGEIYNYQLLRQELIRRGVRFKSNTDTEVLLYLYQYEQENMLHRLNGMFAFAIWDERRNRLFLARDRIGKKPLYYRTEKGRILFASELKSIVCVPGVPKELDPRALDDYLTYQYVPHPKTIYKGISKLAPASFAFWSPNGLSDELQTIRYWDPHYDEQADRLDANQWQEQLRMLIHDAVRIRMQSDVPIGAFLSGGIDSSITAGVMQQESEQKIQTFSIGFEHKEYDETRYARCAAAAFGTNHHEWIVTADIEQLLPKLIWHYDEPFSDSSAIPTFILCEQARREVTVALSGDGGDELFAGYDRYQAVRLGRYAQVLPKWFRSLLAGPIRNMIPASTRQKAFLRRLKRFLEALGMEPLEQYLQWIAVFNRQRRRELYSNDFLNCLTQDDVPYDSLDFLSQARARCMKRDTVTQMSLVDIQTYLPCDLMTKTDIASMAHSLECRAPLLDYRVVQAAIQIPIQYKIQGRYGKTVLKDTFADLLPPEIMQRKKMGFGVPVDHWFRGPLKNMVRDLLLDQQAESRGLFNREFVQKILDEHFANRFDHAYRIWSLFVFELWMRKWMDTPND